MTARAHPIDRLAFAALVPSLVMPIAAMALAAWGIGHADDGHAVAEIGVGLYYFAAMMTLSVTLFSMALNVLLLLQRHADIRAKTIRWSRTVPHYVVALTVLVWATYFTIARMQQDGVYFGCVLVAASIASFGLAISNRISVRAPFTEVPLTTVGRGLLLAHPVVVVGLVGATALLILNQSEAALVGLALLGILGLPFSGATVLLWLPLASILGLASGAWDAVVGPWTLFLALAALPALANSLIGLRLLRSARARRDFVNDVLMLR